MPVAAVMKGSPAEKAGIQKGDILLAMDGVEMKDLRSFSQMLARHSAGDVVKIRFKRGEEEKTVEATLVAR